jgi:hypothetical protein
MLSSALTPDLRQNIMTTVYLTFSHNHVVVAYLLGILISLVLSLAKPSRFSVMMLVGFIILLFAFEYDKHIILPLREQTINSLITATPHHRMERLINIVITELLPILFYASGWLFIFAGIVYAALKINKQK